MSLLGKIIGDSNKRFLNTLQSTTEKINKLEKDFEGVDLKQKTLEFKRLVADGHKLDALLPEAFATVREAAKRTLDQRHFDVQLLAAITLHQGKIAEMKTGEGKTLAATLTVYLNALEGKGVHIVTVNDYLSRRDTVWMGQVYDALGLTVGCINHDTSYLYDSLHIENPKSDLDSKRDTLGVFKVVHEFLKPCLRKEAYGADITYGTNNEFGFDYLRDGMSYDKEQVVQRNHHYVIIDEVDSILIDEARTPLIISAPDEESAELYKTFAKITPLLKKEEHYTIDEKQKAVSLTEEGIERAEEILGIKDIYTEKGIKYVHHLDQALRAHVFFKRDRDYVINNGQVVIVDEFTGRLMPGRRWSEGLHQAIEAREKVLVQKESRTLASVTFQNYFRMYKKLAGMTGTALTSAEEFHKVYALEAVVIPTNKLLVRKDRSDFVYATTEGKLNAVVEETKKRCQKGQPVLIGTVSIEKNEYLSACLKREGVPHRLLNAKHHEEEGEIIAQAGKKGQVTVATNMAGRGVDIVLGGYPQDSERSREVQELGGLFVLGTERHEARRIDDQLRGRSGRQGDSGESRFFVSLEDDLMRVFGSERIKSVMMKMGLPEDQSIENKMITKAIESAQNKIEGMNFDARKHLLEYDDVLNKQRAKIYGTRREILFADKEEFKQMVESRGVEFFAEGGSASSGREDLRALLLRVIDMFWMDHLEAMDYVRSSVTLRAYGNRDPLIEYKNEGVRMFKDLLNSIDATFVKLASQPMQSFPKEESRPVFVKASSGKVGRNSPCPCGSGKKYKRCCA